MATLEDVWAYFRGYDTQSFAVFSCKGNEPSETDVAEFEAQVGFRLPDDFREFTMSPLGGLYMEVHEDLWPRPKPGDVGPFWSFLYGLKVFGIAKGIPEWLDIREQYRAFRDAGDGDLVPFLQVQGDADCYCFDRDGHVIRWSHDLPDERAVVDQSFPTVLLGEITKLESRKRRKVGQVDGETNP